MKSVFTQSAEAYKLYLKGENYHAFLDYPMAIEHLSKAIQLDSGFVLAMLKLAYCYGDTRQTALCKKWAYYDHQNHSLLKEVKDILDRVQG